MGAQDPAGHLGLHDVPGRGADPPALVCQVGSTTLKYQLRAIDDLHAWLVEQGDWVPLGAADEKKAAAPGTVEAWGRSADNPVGGWYGLRKGYRGRFGMYLPPLLEALGLAELTHDPRNNRMRADGHEQYTRVDPLHHPARERRRERAADRDVFAELADDAARRACTTPPSGWTTGSASCTS